MTGTWNRLGKLPSRTLNRAAGVAMLAGLFALGVGIGTGGTLLMIASGAVMVIAGLVPAAVDCRDAKRLVEAARREAAAAVTRPAAEWDMENNGRESGGLVWIEPESPRQRLH
jgi:uncharacterized protein YjeT (DUF2065 family)